MQLMTSVGGFITQTERFCFFVGIDFLTSPVECRGQEAMSARGREAGRRHWWAARWRRRCWSTRWVGSQFEEEELWMWSARWWRWGTPWGWPLCCKAARLIQTWQEVWSLLGCCMAGWSYRNEALSPFDEGNTSFRFFHHWQRLGQTHPTWLYFALSSQSCQFWHLVRDLSPRRRWRLSWNPRHCRVVEQREELAGGRRPGELPPTLL